MKPDSNAKTDLSSTKRALLALKEMQAKLEAAKRTNNEPIAIIGLGCRFPGGANTPAAFWQLLRNGVDAITEVPPDRWDMAAYYDPDPTAPGKMYTRHGGFIDQVDQFDREFFNLSPKETISLDPQHRLILEVSWEALEHANQAPGRLSGTSTGVFIGIGSFDYGMRILGGGNIDHIYGYHGLLGNIFSSAAGRLSYLLGLTGPAIALDTACSSSLVALHLACQSLRLGECNLALAGGVSLLLAPEGNINFCKAGVMSLAGRCKTFDAAADGFVRGEGGGVVVLKKLSDALADGDNVLAIVRGSAVNQNGPSGGLTVPNGKAQEAVMAQALKNAGVEPAQVAYVETHGAGTFLGDVIELSALGHVFGQNRNHDRPLYIGSVKTNVGHLDAAAGMAGLIKTILAIRQQEIPPHLHFNQPNPQIPWSKLPLLVATERTPWPVETHRFGGVNAFGLNGVNAHVVLEMPLPQNESPKTLAPVSPPRQERPLHILTLSAKTAPALKVLAGHYVQWLADHPQASWPDVCFSANTGRSHLRHRLGLVAESVAQARERLATFGQEHDGRIGISQGQTPAPPPKVVFLFTGYGSQYVNMGRQLYQTQPLFRQTLQTCDEILRPHLKESLLSVLYQQPRSSTVLTEPSYGLPALFALEYALAELWQAWGVKPAAVMGHSVGEYVAACVAGCVSLADALTLVAKWGHLMQNLPEQGTMALIRAAKTQVITAIAPHANEVAIAALNGPDLTVISGRQQAVAAVTARLTAEGVETYKLDGSPAFHSPLTDPMQDEFEADAAKITWQAPRLPLISTVTGQPLNSQRPLAAGHWRQHNRGAVNFMAGMAALFEQDYDLFLEIGPQPTLATLGKRYPQGQKVTWLPSLSQGEDDWPVLLNSLSALYVRGVEIDWERFDQDYARQQKYHLPTYPFQRQRYWFADQPPAEPGPIIPENLPPTPNLSAKKRQRLILDDLRLLTATLLRVSPNQIDTETSLLHLAVDSIVLLDTANKVEKRYGVPITIRQFFENLNTLAAIAAYLDQNLPPDWTLPETDSSTVTEKTTVSAPLPPVLTEIEDIEIAATPAEDRRETILSTLRAVAAELLKTSPDNVDEHASFLELGADSLIVVEANRRIENTYGLQLKNRQFFEELSTLAALAAYIDQNLPPDWGAPESPPPDLTVDTSPPPETPNITTAPVEPPKSAAKQKSAAPATAVERIMAQQLETMSQLMAQQLEVLRGRRSAPELPQTPAVNEVRPALAQMPMLPAASSALPFPIPQVAKTPSPHLTPQQADHLAALVERYTQRTPQSKQLTQRYRPVLADNRASAGFRFSIKEMLYPIVGQRAEGARMWDVDGNEYIDLTMGFGVNLFGHRPNFITAALQAQLQQGMQLGPQTKLAGEVAELISELTGMARVIFCNSGTEAVMTALRLARAATGRPKVAMFAGAYHGHFDGTLAMARNGTEDPAGIPVLPGISPNMVADVLVLDYGSPQSLDVLQRHADQLAAVLVSPVQSRQPDLQPREFLHQLRQFTTNNNIALIFDEIITGFRIHPGGAQAWFGVTADMATYGKIIGGGMPIGVVAGRAEYLDGVDGGMWQYGDNSYPGAETTFFAGTFCKHPLAMAAARATLQHIKTQGPQLQARLNRQTDQLVATLNNYFSQNHVPIRVAHFGSLFRFEFSGNMDLLFYHLLEKGIYVWEGRACFLSTAHTDDDLAAIIQAVTASIDELRAGGFLPQPAGQAIESSPPSPAGPTTPPPPARVTPQNEPDPQVIRRVPLTEAQKQLWALAQLWEGGSLAYNMCVGLQLRGPLRLEAMQQAVQQVVARHEALRTTISSDGQFQEIWSTWPVELSLTDYSNVPEPEHEAKATAWLNAESRHLFDLTRGPLFRAGLLKLAANRHVAALTAHHIVADGWSAGVLMQELGARYSAICQGRQIQWDPPMQFRTYAEWLAQQNQTKAMAAHEAYWLAQFANSIPVLNLPTDHPRPAIRTYRGRRKSVRLPAHLGRKLRQVGLEHNCTLFMTLLAAYIVLLHRLTGQDDVRVDIPTSGRTLEGSETMVGFCANQLPIRSYLTGPTTFAAHLAKTRELLLDAYEHHDYPYARLLDHLFKRKNSPSPLATTIFNMNPPIPMPEVFELEAEWFSEPINFVAHEISLHATELDDGQLALDCDYDCTLFEDATIARILGHFETLLQAIVVDPHQPIAQLPLLTPAERHQLLVDFNNPPVAYPQSNLPELFAAQVERTPEAVALVFEDQQLTYHELNARANQVAHHLQTLGVGPEVLVALYVERSLDLVVGLLGILKAGGAYVPLDPALPPERLAFILADTQAPLVLTQQALAEKLPPRETGFVYLDTDWPLIARHSKQNPTTIISPENAAYVIYTSGSTGEPKGVVVTHGNISRLFEATQGWFNFDHRDVWTLFHSYAFDFSVWELWGALLYGGRLVVVPYWISRSPAAFYKLLAKEQVTVLNQTPSAFRQLIQTEETLGANPNLALRRVIFGGEALEPQSLTPWFERHGDQAPQLVNMYGITETTVHVTYQPLTTKDLKTTSGSPIGTPIPDLQVYILDQTRQPVPIGVVGELYVGGAGVARGYLNRPALTAEKFIPNPFLDDENKTSILYQTGDLARYRADGSLEYLGRIDRQVKIRGFRIELGDVEAAINQHPQVRQSVVVDQDTPTGPQLVAYIVSTQSEPPATGELHRFLRDKLPDYMLPAIFVNLDDIPLTPNGKTDYRALPMPGPANLKSTADFVPPQTPTEKLLAQLWADVLGLEKVGIHDDFFELGGHSIVAIQIITRAYQAGLRVTPQQLFQYHTIAELAAVAEMAPVLPAEEDSPKTHQFSQPVMPEIPTDLEPELPAHAEAVYSLAPTQQGMLFHTLFDPDSAVYFEQFSCTFDTSLNTVAFRQAWQQVINRHPVLRTFFVWENQKEPLQIVRQNVKLPWIELDWREMPAPQQQAELQTLLDADRRRGFAFDQAPLTRCALIRLGQKKYRFIWSHHHILLDGWCIPLILKEVFFFYQAFSQAQTLPLLDPPRPYADYIAWLQQQDAAKAETLWHKMLQGFSAPTRLPGDTGPKRRGDPAGRYEKQHLRLPASTTTALQSLARQHKLTLNSVIQGVWALLLGVYSGEKDVVFGVTVSGRPPALTGVEAMVGLFINTLPVRAQITGETSLLLWLQNLQTQLMAEEQYAYTSLVEIQGWSDVPRGTPLFESLLVFQNFPLAASLAEWQEALPIDEIHLSQKTNYPLNLIVLPGAELAVEIGYDESRFEATAIRRILSNIETMLTHIAATGLQQSPLSVSLLTQTERQQILEEWNNTQVSFPRQDKCLHRLFEKQAKQTPEAVAVVFEDQQLTYHELNAKANQLAHHLQALGIGPDVLVGLCLERSPEMVIALLAVLKAGGAYVPLDPAYPPQRLAFMLADAQAPVLLTQQRLRPNLPKQQAHLICLDSDWDTIAQEKQSNPTGAVASENLAYVIYTSGSTGQPKGVMLTHRAICNHMAWFQHTFSLTAADKVLQKTPFSFDAAIWEFYAPLLVGAQLVLVKPGGHQDSAYLVQCIVEQQITILQLVPSLLRLLVADDDLARCGSLRHIFCGGEALPVDLAKQLWAKLDVKLHNLYGPTEACIDATWWTCQADNGQPVMPIGRPIANTWAYILDEQLNPVPVGAPGELHLGGASLARGYLNQLELTAQKFIPNPFVKDEDGKLKDEEKPRVLYKTGDLARYQSNGIIEFLGRVDHQLKVRGFRVEPGEIETTLRQHPAVQQCVVVARQDRPEDSRLVAYLVLDQPTDTATTEFRHFLRDKLPSYMIPSDFVMLEALSLTPNGKIDRRALPAPDRSRQDTPAQFVAPRDTLELQLVQIWEEVLAVRPIGVRDDFFDLGGHSLLALRLLAQIQARFGSQAGANLALGTLFQKATIEQLARFIRQQPGNKPWSALVPIQPTGRRPPFFCIHPMGGNVLCYAGLARHLEPDQPFYGLQAVGLDGAQSPLPTIEEMAAHYIDVIRTVQPDGPYQLGGWSFGGIIAFEMAQQLTRQGQSVAALALVDSYAAESVDELPDDAQLISTLLNDPVALFGREVALPLAVADLKDLSLAEQMRYIGQQAKEIGLLPQEADLSQLHRLWDVFKSNAHAYHRYQPQPYPEQLMLFQAGESQSGSNQKPDWPELAPNVEIHKLPGNHYTLLEEPHVQVLATHLNAYLAPSVRKPK
ncbi:MAG: amino acid adenylation domain-containing protein [Anaerolineae bacterium]|nr:amino acid adenylation domain-containing protein [Anaerolineae bacterium]